MKNKSLLLKFGVMVLAISCFSLSSTFATNFHLNVDNMTALESELEKNLHPIHFADNGNDFWGFFYISNGLWNASGNIATSEYIYEVTIWGWSPAAWEKYQCARQVRWFYYNAERWERLWPLDDQTWKNIPWISGLNTSWWIYTLCAQEGYQAALDECEEGIYSECEQCDYNECVAKVRNDFSAGGYGYYWGVQQSYSGDTYNLIMWVDYDASTDWFITPESGSDLASTFVRLNNKFPVWFIYDNKWWLGLAWCMFTSLTGGSMKNLIKEVKKNWMAGVFKPAGTWYIMYSGTLPITCTGISFQDELTKILIEWIMWLSNSGTWWDTKFWTIGNSSDTKMQYFVEICP